MSKVYSLCCFINTTTVYYIPPHVYIYTTACMMTGERKLLDFYFENSYSKRTEPLRVNAPMMPTAPYLRAFNLLP